jgi:hypothetical protein
VTVRHLTWAITWFVVGLGITLGTASVLQQVVIARQAARPTAIEPAPVAPAPVIKPPAEGRDVVVASRRFNRVER